MDRSYIVVANVKNNLSQQKLATTAVWTRYNPILRQGEIGLETQGVGVAPKIKIGDGVTRWNDLPYLSSSTGTSSSPFQFTQSSASTTWNIPHNLGHKPVVNIFSTGWTEIMAQVTHTDNNNTVVSFDTAQAGYAVLI